MKTDEVCFQKESISGNRLSDYISSPVLSYLIKYRVKLLLMEDSILFQGNQEIVETTCLIKKEYRTFVHTLRKIKISFLHFYVKDIYQTCSLEEF